MKNPLKAKLLQGEISFGSWIQLGHPGVAEILSGAGFDWVAIDCEHGALGLEQMANTMRGMYGRGAMPMVRVTENSTMAIRQPLDAGALGVFVPLVDSPEDARRAVRAARFPPEGERGFAYFRANDYGKDFIEYAETANSEIVVIVMIETKTAVHNIDAILSVPGVDGTLIGPYDLSGSYGVPGKLDDRRVLEGCSQVVHACARAGKAAGIHLVKPTPEVIKGTIEAGYRLIALGMDTVFLADSAKGVMSTAADIAEKTR